MRIELDNKGNRHMHAQTAYGPLTIKDYINGVVDLLYGKIKGVSTLNFHIPYEVQFKSYKSLSVGYRFMNFIMILSKLLNVKTIWENSNILNTKDWSSLENCSFIPNNYPLCLDIGHLILGATSKNEALKIIDTHMVKYGSYIKHLHLHINDFIHDKHIYQEKKVKEFLGEDRFKKIIKNRSYIFEIGE